MHIRRVDARDLSPVVQAVSELRRRIDPARAVLVGLSGIGGSGKGYVGGRLSQELTAAGLRVALIRGDDWLAPPSVRFDHDRSPMHYYEHAMRLEELFHRLLGPLVRDRSIDVSIEGAHNQNIESMRTVRIAHEQVDVVVVEAVYIFKRGVRAGFSRERFDLRLWIDCTFETALDRALDRAQEDLPHDLARAEYEQVYFPAQRIHAQIDDPRSCAHLILVNDHRLSV